MNDITIGKEELQKALLEASKNYLENIELAPAETVSYSPRLERKMARLLKSMRKPYRKFIDTPYKKAIAACLTVAILAGVLMSCKPIREPVVEFFTSVYEKFTEFFFGAEDKEAASKVIEEVHTLTYVPEGYELVESPTLTGEDAELCTIWRADDDSEIVFRQNILSTKATFDAENAETKIVSDRLKIAIIRKETYTYVFWNDNDYAYSLITEHLSEDEIEKIIFSFS